MRKYLFRLGKQARIASINTVNSKKKDKVLKDYYNLILKNQAKIISQNKKDLIEAKYKKLQHPLIKRLLIDEIKIKQIIR